MQNIFQINQFSIIIIHRLSFMFLLNLFELRKNSTKWLVLFSAQLQLPQKQKEKVHAKFDSGLKTKSNTNLGKLLIVGK